MPYDANWWWWSMLMIGLSANARRTPLWSDVSLWNHVSLWSNGEAQKRQGRLSLVRVWACQLMLACESMSACEVMEKRKKKQGRVSLVRVLACQLMLACEFMSACEVMEKQVSEWVTGTEWFTQYGAWMTRPWWAPVVTICRTVVTHGMNDSMAKKSESSQGSSSCQNL